jgi:aspartate 1-decarboxylase
METLRKVLRCKIHRATITGADLNYEGSITLAPELLEAAGLAEYEAVNIWNVTSGTRFETYTIKGEPGSSDICVNGAAAHLVTPGDIIIIAAFQMIAESKLPGYEPTVVFVDGQNRIKELRPEVAGPKMPPSAVRV